MAFNEPMRSYSSGVGRISQPGHESLCQTIFNIRPGELEIVVALAAAHAVGLPGRTCGQLLGLTGHGATRGMTYLERNRWVVRIARVEKSTTWVWTITEHGLRRLEVLGWKPKLHTAGELEALGNVTLGKVFTIEEEAEPERAAS